MISTVLTGATGFLGGHIAGCLIAKDIQVTALLRSTSSAEHLPQGCLSHRVDFMESDSMERGISGADMVIHCAGATSAKSQEEFDRANALITRRVLEARQRFAESALFVYVSSQAASGPGGRGPVTAYGRSKLLGEMCVRETGNWIIIRPPAIFGPGDPASRPVIGLADRGVFLSPLSNRGGFCLVYVEDAARLIASLHQYPAAVERVLEPSYGRIFTWREFHRILQAGAGRRILHVRIPPFMVRAAGFMSEALASMTGNTPFFCRDKCRELLARDWETDGGLTEELTGWRPATPVEEAMRRTFEYYRNGRR